MAFSNRVTTITQDKIMPKVVDTVLDSNVLFTRMANAAEKWSGTQLKYPVKFEKNTTGTSFSGFDQLPTTSTNNRVNLTFDPKFYSITSALPKTELSANATDEKVLSLIAVTVASDAQDMADDLGTIFYADGTGNGGKDPLGLTALVDDGTTVATIGGLARSTYTTLQSTVTSIGGNVTLADFRTHYNAVSSGSQKPSVGMATEAVFGYYEELLQPDERIVKDAAMMKNGLVGGTGFVGLSYMGFPILADEKAVSGELSFLNERFLHWNALSVEGAERVPYKAGSIEGNDYSNVPGLGFSWSGWKEPVDQAAYVGFTYFAGEFNTDNPKRHGRLTGITGA